MTNQIQDQSFLPHPLAPLGNIHLLCDLPIASSLLVLELGLGILFPTPTSQPQVNLYQITVSEEGSLHLIPQTSTPTQATPHQVARSTKCRKISTKINNEAPNSSSRITEQHQENLNPPNSEKEHSCLDISECHQGLHHLNTYGQCQEARRTTRVLHKDLMGTGKILRTHTSFKVLQTIFKLRQAEERVTEESILKYHCISGCRLSECLSGRDTCRSRLQDRICRLHIITNF